MRRTGPILIAVIGILALVIDFWPRLRVPDFSSGGAGSNRLIETKLGLDLRGGLYVEYQVQDKDDRSPTADDLGVIRTIVERRVNATGVAEPVVTTQGRDRIVIELPGVSDPNEVRALVGQTGRLDFVPLQAPCQTEATEGQTLDLEVCKPLFAGEELESAAVGTDENGRRSVTFRLKPNGAQLFADYTAANVGRNFAIVLDSQVISAPNIRQEIRGGDVQITAGSAAGFSLQEAQRLVNVLNYGSLPFPIVEIRSDTLDPTLGAEFVTRSLLAGGIAIGLVVLFMLFHYRLPGLIASGALIYYSLVVLAVFRLIPVTLTLAGIAGFVLSVGMAVDANILIFERTKEELRLGKSLPTAVEAGFNRAWNSILDSNVSSIITALILFLFGSSVIKGFALVLIIGVLISMFTAITVTRTILRIVVQFEWARSARLFGVGEGEFLARPTGRALRGEARGRV